MPLVGRPDGGVILGVDNLKKKEHRILLKGTVKELLFGIFILQKKFYQRII